MRVLICTQSPLSLISFISMERKEIKTLYLPKNAQVGIFRIVRRIQRQNYERLCWRPAAPYQVDIIHLILARCSYWIYSWPAPRDYQWNGNHGSNKGKTLPCLTFPRFVCISFWRYILTLIFVAKNFANLILFSLTLQTQTEDVLCRDA